MLVLGQVTVLGDAIHPKEAVDVVCHADWRERREKGKAADQGCVGGVEVGWVQMGDAMGSYVAAVLGPRCL